MKKLLLGIFLLAGCRTAPSIPEPQPAVPVGFSFNTPCQAHGEDTWTVQGVEQAFLYSLTSSDGGSPVVDEASLLEVFQELGIVVDTK